MRRKALAAQISQWQTQTPLLRRADAAVGAVLSGSVAMVTFQQACKELPRSVSVVAKFLEVLEPFTFAGTQKIADVRAQGHLMTQVFPRVMLSWVLHAAIAYWQHT